MHSQKKSYTTESILAALGYTDPLVAARQQARMLLLGRLARYQAAISQIEHKRTENLAELRAAYKTKNQEIFDADDDYLDWQWYHDAIKVVKDQLAVITG